MTDNKAMQKQAAEQESLPEVKVMASDLEKYGGFSFVEMMIDGVENLNPDRKARKNIFLTEENRREDREMLARTLSTWIDLLSAANSLGEMQQSARERVQVLEQQKRKNLQKAITACRYLEQSYRSIALFYSNTLEEKLKNVTIVNASMEQLTDLDTPVFINYIGNELKQNFDRLDLRNNYSLLIVPGYLGSNKVLEKWAHIANKNKAMLITDFAHFDRSDDAIDMFTSSNLVSADISRSNVCMACNWVVGRGQWTELGEQEALYVSPAAALAGRLYSSRLSQVTAGKKYGALYDVDAVAFDLRKSEVSQLEQLGLIPMVNEYGKVMAFSGKTLFNGDNIGLQTYSVVRVFDHISKVLCDFLNRRAFENWDNIMERDLRSQIVDFLNSITGSDNLIESFNIVRLMQDPDQKDRVYLDIHIMPYFPAKSFVLRLDGYKGEDEATTWQTEYAQA